MPRMAALRVFFRQLSPWVKWSVFSEQVDCGGSGKVFCVFNVLKNVINVDSAVRIVCGSVFCVLVSCEQRDCLSVTAIFSKRM